MSLSTSRELTRRAIISAVAFLTASGRNSADEALEFWRQGARANQRMAETAGWDPVQDWRSIWSEVGDRLAARLDENGDRAA